LIHASAEPIQDLDAALRYIPGPDIQEKLQASEQATDTTRRAACSTTRLMQKLKEKSYATNPLPLTASSHTDGAFLMPTKGCALVINTHL